MLAVRRFAPNRALIEAAFAKTPGLREAFRAAARDALAAHPGTTSSCVEPN
jgi:hypothetical protein